MKPEYRCGLIKWKKLHLRSWSEPSSDWSSRLLTKGNFRLKVKFFFLRSSVDCCIHWETVIHRSFPKTHTTLTFSFLVCLSWSLLCLRLLCMSIFKSVAFRSNQNPLHLNVQINALNDWINECVAITKWIIARIKRWKGREKSHGWTDRNSVCCVAPDCIQTSQ